MHRDAVNIPRFLAIGTPRCGMHFFVSAVQRATLGKLICLHEVCFMPTRVRLNPMYCIPWAEGSYAALRYVERLIGEKQGADPEIDATRVAICAANARPFILHVIRDRDECIESLKRNGFSRPNDQHVKFILGEERAEKTERETLAQVIYDEWNERCAKVADETVNIKNIDREWLQDFLGRMRIDCEVKQEHLDKAVRSESTENENRLGIKIFKNERPSAEEIQEIARGILQENMQC